ncbi:MAG: putative Ig domain-containing protein, partial [Deltaproteobacteria bacterium]
MGQSLHFISRFKILSTITLLLFAQLFHSTTAAAAPQRGISFKNPLVLPQGTAGVAYSVDLRTLLADPGVPPYRWSAVKLPEGLSVDSANNLIKGTPTTVGTFTPALTVSDSTPEGTILNNPATIVISPAPPKFNISELDLGVTKEGGTLTVDISQYLTDPKSAQSFSATGLPTWLSLDSKTGKLSGSPAYTPNHSLAGPFSGITITASNSSGSSKLKAFGSVLKVIVPPKWSANPITLEDAFEDSAYSAETAKYVVNTEGTAIKYTIVNMTPPPWLKISATSGTLFGTPSNSGKVSVVVSLSTVIDGATYTDSTTFNLTVIDVNHPPKWLANPIVLPETTN